MISREELALLSGGAMHEAAIAIEAVAGRRLTSSEMEAMGGVIKTAMLIVSDRSAAKAPLPPPAPGPRPPRPFNPLATQELRAVPKDVGKK
jgi:hypothetical protein